MFPWDICVFLPIWKKHSRVSTLLAAHLTEKITYPKLCKFPSKDTIQRYHKGICKTHFSHLVVEHEAFHPKSPHKHTEASLAQRPFAAASLGLWEVGSVRYLGIASPVDFCAHECYHEQSKRQTIKVALKRLFCLQTEAEAISKGIQHILCSQLLTIPNKKREIAINTFCNSANQKKRDVYSLLVNTDRID